MRRRENPHDYRTGHPIGERKNRVVMLGGITIEVVGEMALVHHGGYYNELNQWETQPFIVPWRTQGANRQFDLYGWACRILMVLEGERWISMLAHPIYTTDGQLTVDWTHGLATQQVGTRQVTVVEA